MGDLVLFPTHPVFFDAEGKPRRIICPLCRLELTPGTPVRDVATKDGHAYVHETCVAPETDSVITVLGDTE
jgi:hypothetical protein